MSSWIKKELKRAEKERRRCAKLYKDWKDDEYNSGPNKFVFGIISNSDFAYNKGDVSSIDKASFYTLNDLQIYYNRDTHRYILDIETYHNKKEGELLYLERLLSKFKDFMKIEYKYSDSLLTNNSLCEYINTHTSEDYWSSTDIYSLYKKFNIFVLGYSALCRNKK
jgi:hypothetical protein